MIKNTIFLQSISLKRMIAGVLSYVGIQCEKSHSGRLNNRRTWAHPRQACTCTVRWPDGKSHCKRRRDRSHRARIPFPWPDPSDRAATERERKKGNHFERWQIGIRSGFFCFPIMQRCVYYRPNWVEISSALAALLLLLKQLACSSNCFGTQLNVTSILTQIGKYNGFIFMRL